MPDKEIKNDNSFIIETTKDNPLVRRKLLRKTMTTVFMAILFGMIACITIMIVQPALYKTINNQKEPTIVLFPEDEEEMSPEDMLLAGNTVDKNSQSGALTADSELLSSVIAGKDDYKELYDVMQDYVAELNRSMVTVTAINSGADWYNSIKDSKNQSSGVILTSNGMELLILTEAEYSLGAEELILTFCDGSNVNATIKGCDSNTGIAILAAPISNLSESTQEAITFAKLGSSNNSKMLGMPVIAMGSPTGFGGSVSYGIITSDKSTVSMPDINYKIIYTDIDKNANASGVLFNLDHGLVGVITENSTQESDVSLCAYGITELRKILEKLSNQEEIAYLGISGISVPQEIINSLGVPKGAFVSKVEIGSPAARAGIQQGDIIVQMNGRTISTFLEYTNLLYQMNSGDEVDITIRRKVQEEYKESEITLKTDEMK